MISRGVVLQLENSIDVEPDALTLYDLSRYQSNGTMRGAGQPNAVQLPSGTWIWVFASGDWIEVTAPQMNFTSELFSGLAWVNTSVTATVQTIMIRGLGGIDGWGMLIHTNGRIDFETYQAAASQLSYAAGGAVPAGAWCLCGWTRNGASCRVYVNGVDVTNTVGVHINPLTSARTVKIGIGDNKVAYPFVGLMSPFLWFSYTLTPGQILNHYEKTKHWFGIHD